MPSGKRVCVVAALVCVCWSSKGLADEYDGLAEPSPPPPVEMVVTHEWYGRETLLFDAGAGLLFLGARPASGVLESTLNGIGSLAFLSGPFGVHLAHQRTGAAFASLGLRVALPLIGFAIGLRNADCEADDSERGALSGDCRLDETPAFRGALIGAAVASAIDSGALTHETIRTPRDPAGTGRLQPGLVVKNGGARLTLRATF